MGPLISTVELDERLRSRRDDGELIVLDATTLLPGEAFDPQEMFAQAHLPGARWLDLDAFSDPDGDLPHMVPSQGRFARLVGALGVSGDTEVVFYGQTTVASAARAWWLFGLFGHDRARVLDGGLRCWRAEGRALEAGAPTGVLPPRSASRCGSSGLAAAPRAGSPAAVLPRSAPRLKRRAARRHPGSCGPGRRL